MFKANNSYQKDYEIFWDTPFPNGKTDISLIGGNTDSSDFETSLSELYEWSEVSSWSEFAQELFDSFKTNTSASAFNALMFCIDNSYTDKDIPDEQHDLRQAVLGCTTPLELFSIIVEEMHDDLDPSIFVRSDNPLLLWLREKRW